MSILIKCPNCQHEFDLEEVMTDEIRKGFREQTKEYITKKEAELKKKFEEDSKKYQQQIGEEVKKKAIEEVEAQMSFLQESNKKNEDALKIAREKEIELLRKEQEMKQKESEFELKLMKALSDQRSNVIEQIKKEELEKNNIRENDFQLKIKELEKQLDQQKILAEEMRKKAEQGSMQLQGEVQELALEEMLRNAFPFDKIEEVGKGIKGADCIQTVRNKFGHDCGKIIFESKRTSNFSNDWIDKLKTDMRAVGADVAVLVTQALPKDFDKFGEKDGIYICSFWEATGLTSIIRDGIIRIFQATKAKENVGDKMHLLYDYLTSNEFSEQWKAIREGFLSMKFSIQKERDTMERLWKAREKQLEKVLLNTVHIKGSIEGIAGADSFNMLEDFEDTNLLEE